MKYIETIDLEAVIQGRFLDESTANVAGDSTTLDNIELKAIEYVISYISTRYNTDLIFAATPVRNSILRQIIAQIVVYRSVRRNAARKVPEDYVKLESDATKQLEKIQSGAMTLVGLPLLESTDAPVMWGNNRKDNNYI